MQSPHTRNRSRVADRNPTGRCYWSGFSVCLFVVLLAVFTWVVHRRLTQYESAQGGGHHMTATKVCLMERPRVSIPAPHAVNSTAAFFVAALFAFAPFGANVSQALQKRGDSFRPRCDLRNPPGLTHFFFLPPPAASLAS